MNLLDFRNFLLKFVLRNLFSHRVKSLKNNSCLSSHGLNKLVHIFFLVRSEVTLISYGRGIQNSLWT